MTRSRRSARTAGSRHEDQKGKLNPMTLTVDPDRCSMCTRPIGQTASGLCGYCVKHKCRPENEARIRAKRTAAAIDEQRAKVERKCKPVTLPGSAPQWP